MARTGSPIPEGYHTVTPQLIFDNTAQAIDWYKKALGAEEKARAVAPDGKIMHSELQIGNSRIMLNDAMGGGKSAKGFDGLPISLWVYVQDCDAMFKSAVGAGARVAPVQWDRWPISSGAIGPEPFIDPYGYQWTIATHIEDLSREELDRRAQDFFKKVRAAANTRVESGAALASGDAEAPLFMAPVELEFFDHDHTDVLRGRLPNSLGLLIGGVIVEAKNRLL